MRYALLPTAVVLLSLLAASPLPARGGEPASPPSDGDATLTVRLADVRNARGDLRLGVFVKADGFPKDRAAALLWRSLPARDAERGFALDLPPGRYAVVVLHDENGNKKLDANWLGIPTEGHGVTNNPKPLRRAARFTEATFDLPANGAEVTVSMQYKYL